MLVAGKELGHTIFHPTPPRRKSMSNFLRMSAPLIFAWLLAPQGFSQNVLVNGDFETNPPPNFGNNIGWSIAPWVLGSGNQANVVKVDGPGGYNYGTNGPQSDASAPGAGIPQHYLDIANGTNDFYQSFTPRCSGTVNFGGYFSTRGNAAGTASVAIRNGVGTSGTVVGSTQTINLPGGTSMTDPWTLAAFSVNVTAGNPYSFIVSMDNQMNFDNGYVSYIQDCPEIPVVAIDPCCPPWNSDVLLHQLRLTQPGDLLSNVAYNFLNSAPYNQQMQAYIDYLHAINPSIRNIVIYWDISDHGPSGSGTSPQATGTQIGPAEFTEWSCTGCQGYSTIGGNGNLTNGNGSNVFDPTQHPLPANRWYRISTWIYLNDGNHFWQDEKCSSVAVDLSVYAGAVLRVSAPNRIAVEVRQPGALRGRIISLPVTRTPATNPQK
jgi:hypothetical protein